jgi:hypothetical protein
MEISAIILACKGPWAGLWIEESTIIGYYCAGAGAIITLALSRESVRGYQVGIRLIIAWLLLLLHPAWTIRADGDCGALKTCASLLVTITHLAILVYQYFMPLRNSSTHP